MGGGGASVFSDRLHAICGWGAEPSHSNVRFLDAICKQTWGRGAEPLVLDRPRAIQKQTWVGGGPQQCLVFKSLVDGDLKTNMGKWGLPTATFGSNFLNRHQAI